MHEYGIGIGAGYRGCDTVHDGIGCAEGFGDHAVDTRILQCGDVLFFFAPVYAQSAVSLRDDESEFVGFFFYGFVVRGYFVIAL